MTTAYLHTITDEPLTWCAGCGAARPAAELLRVVELATGRARFVCRPSTDSRCFNAAVGPRIVDRIELADRRREGR